MCWSGQCVNKSTGDRQADRSEQSHCGAELHTHLAQPQGNTSTCFLCMGVLSYNLLFNFRTLHPVIWLICLFDLFLYSYTYSHHVHYHTFFSSLYTLCLSYHQHHTLYTIHTYTIHYTLYTIHTYTTSLQAWRQDCSGRLTPKPWPMLRRTFYEESRRCWTRRCLSLRAGRRKLLHTCVLSCVIRALYCLLFPL